MQQNNTIRILSLGWGLQSFTLAAMAALGEVEPIDYVIHADTSWERHDTYQFSNIWAPWLADHGLEVITVKEPSTKGKAKDEWGATLIPAHTLNPNGSQGMLRRQCTGRWKIQPMRKHISKLLKDRDLKKTPGVVDQLIGITLDEWHRAKGSDVKYINNIYPLLDKRMTRQSCINWLQARNLSIPVKSSCVICPFINNQAWQQMKRSNGKDWETARMVDSQIREERPPYKLYCHRKCKPLAEAVVIPEDYGWQQMDFLEISNDVCDAGYCFL